MSAIESNLTTILRDLEIDWAVTPENVLILTTKTPLSVRRGVRAVCDTYPAAATIEVTREHARIQL